MNKLLVKRLKEIDLSIDDILKTISFADDSIVILYTSHLEGLGNKSSDLDIYVISKSDNNEINLTEKRKGEKWVTDIKYIKNISLDIEYWNIQDVYNIVNNISDSTKQLNTDYLTFINRLMVGEAINNLSLANEIKEVISKSNFKKNVLKEMILTSNSWLDDAIKMFNAKEYLCSLLCTNYSLDFALQSNNIKNGIYTLKSKWIPKIAYNIINDKEIYKQYIEIQFFTNINESNIKNHIENKILLIQNILSIINLE
ncbi:hypothetical protein [Clostridium sp.]|uniref:hypothetical protein n=1 Tax=Clostridium sp. TaxID=1506 RepID=UPI003F40FC19